MHMYIELAWGCSTVLGILLFMIEVAVLCWIQFYNVLKPAAYVATAILVPFVAVFIMFAFIFYRNLVGHTYEVRKTGIQELEMLKHGLELGDVDLSGRKSTDQIAIDNIIWKFALSCNWVLIKFVDFTLCQWLRWISWYKFPNELYLSKFKLLLRIFHFLLFLSLPPILFLSCSLVFICKVFKLLLIPCFYSIEISLILYDQVYYLRNTFFPKVIPNWKFH